MPHPPHLSPTTPDHRVLLWRDRKSRRRWSLFPTPPPRSFALWCADEAILLPRAVNEIRFKRDRPTRSRDGNQRRE